jgi:hypothetical protein
MRGGMDQIVPRAHKPEQSALHHLWPSITHFGQEFALRPDCSGRKTVSRSVPINRSDVDAALIDVE